MRMMRLVKDITIKITVVIVIEKSSLGGKAGYIEPISWSFFKGIVAVINEQFIMTFESITIADSGYIYIEKSIAIYIGHSYSCAPVGASSYSGFISNIFKFKISFV